MDELIKRALALPSQMSLDEQAYIQNQLARYACVLACAAMERALVQSLSTYALKIGDGRLERYVEASFSRGITPTPEQIAEMLGRFDNAWRDELNSYFAANPELKPTVNSVVSNRLRIAHGLSSNLSIGSMRDWAPSARAVSLKVIAVTTS